MSELACSQGASLCRQNGGRHADNICFVAAVWAYYVVYKLPGQLNAVVGDLDGAAAVLALGLGNAPRMLFRLLAAGCWNCTSSALNVIQSRL